MIEIVTGDFFDYEADIRVNTVNCVGVMGAGVALAFKIKYPKMFEEYAKACAQKIIRPGKPLVWFEDDMFHHSGLTIINFPTKDHWRDPSEYEFIESGLVWLAEFLSGNPGKTITVPALGCGHGGLDWEIVRPMIKQYLDIVPAKVLLFEPASSKTTGSQDVYQKELEENNIKIISPDETIFPQKLKGKTATNLYIKGQFANLNYKIVSIIIDTKADEREKLAVSKCLDLLSAQKITFLLGFSSSFEIDMVKSLLIAKANLIIALPYGILELKIRKDLQPYWEESNITIISLSLPKQSWKPSESIKALKFRLKMSDVVLIANYNVAALEKFEKEFKLPGTNIFYINYWKEKVGFFDRINAKQIGRNKETSLPNLSHVIDSIS
jgi:O-acetyl-ADP-ribose deacetylase (regulator of RNase III)